MTTTSTYPAEVDAIVRPVPGGPGVGTDLDASGDLGHATQHIRIADALQATQETLGVMPQGSHSSVAARLDAGGATVHQWCAVAAYGNAVATSDGETPVAGNTLIVPAGHALTSLVSVTAVAADGSVYGSLWNVAAVRAGGPETTALQFYSRVSAEVSAAGTLTGFTLDFLENAATGAVEVNVYDPEAATRVDVRWVHLTLTPLPT